MKHVLEPLARIPGICTAALVTPDGVPIAVHQATRTRPGTRQAMADADGHGGNGGKHEDEQLDAKELCSASYDPAADINALAGLAVSWHGSITRSVAPLSWSAPRQLVLRAARGTLILMQAPGALLLVVLEGGIRHEELRLPMQVAVARMERHVRDMTAHSSTPGDGAQPQGIFPSRTNTPDAGALAPRSGIDAVHSVGGLGPEVSGE